MLTVKTRVLLIILIVIEQLKWFFAYVVVENIILVELKTLVWTVYDVVFFVQVAIRSGFFDLNEEGIDQFGLVFRDLFNFDVCCNFFDISKIIFFSWIVSY